MNRITIKDIIDAYKLTGYKIGVKEYYKESDKNYENGIASPLFALFMSKIPKGRRKELIEGCGWLSEFNHWLKEDFEADYISAFYYTVFGFIDSVSNQSDLYKLGFSDAKNILKSLNEKLLVKTRL